MKQNVPSRPIHIGLFRADAVMAQPDFGPHPVQQLGGLLRNDFNFHPRNFRHGYSVVQDDFSLHYSMLDKNGLDLGGVRRYALRRLFHVGHNNWSPLQMNTVHLSMYVWDNEDIELSQNWTMLTWQTELPFIPFVGLEIQLPLQRAWRLRSVCWDVEKKCFHCHFEDLFTDPLSSDGLDRDDWIEDLTSTGWKAHGPYPNAG